MPPTSPVNIPSILLVVVYVAVMVVNGLVSAGVGVPLTNPALSDAHPVYLTPQSWAFAIWGIIYLLIGVYIVSQVLPVNAGDSFYTTVRPWAALALVTNAVWLYLFAYQLFWLALLDISVYLATLYKLVALADVDAVSIFSEDARSRKWKRLGVHAAFAVNGAWVSVATLLQFSINLVEEGYYPSADLTLGLFGILAIIACLRALWRADWLWAAATAWALGAVSASQGSTSQWGCLSRVCAACAEGPQRICQRDSAAPLGWASACSQQDNIITSTCAVDKSQAVQVGALVAIAAVVIALVLGITRSVLKMRREEKEASHVDSPFRRIGDA